MKNNIVFKRFLLLLAIVIGHSFNTLAQGNSSSDQYPAISLEPFSDSANHWYGLKDDSNIINALPDRPKYKETEITKIADNILIFQRDNGGWPKNYDVQAILTEDQINRLVKTKALLHTTFDNSTTHSHIDYLAKVYTLTKIEKYKEACLKGIQFTLSAQYPNGGWPQYFPLENNYSRHITYNDGAFIGIMKFLKKINDNDADYAFIGKEMREKVKQAYDKGLDCILKTQIMDNGRLTVWCQQHDEVTLAPAWARAYEMPSICNGESASIVLFLMTIQNPDKPVIQAIQSAVKWFEDSKILNTTIKTIQAPDEDSKYRKITTDKIVVIDSTAPPIWTRYYELGTDKPIFSDRNSKILYSMAEVSRERRTGYGWYTYAPKDALQKYPKWQKKWCPEINVLNK